MEEKLAKARKLLAEVTPLKRDCGRVCGQRCCRPMEGEETGMLLMSGEEICYREKPGWTVRETAQGPLVICPGRCDREERPLACRLFPLLPLPDAEGRIRVKVDLRARGVCPLVRQGLAAMDPDFIAAVQEAGECLMQKEAYADCLRRWAREQEEWKRLRKEWGSEHV